MFFKTKQTLKLKRETIPIKENMSMAIKQQQLIGIQLFVINGMVGKISKSNLVFHFKCLFHILRLVLNK